MDNISIYGTDGQVAISQIATGSTVLDRAAIAVRYQIKEVDYMIIEGFGVVNNETEFGAAEIKKVNELINIAREHHKGIY